MSTNLPATEVGRSAVAECLSQIIDPCSAANGTNMSLVEMGMVKDIEIRDGDVSVSLLLTSPACFMLEFFFKEIRERVGGLPGVQSVEVKTDGGFEWEPQMMDGGRRREYLHALGRALPVVNKTDIRQ